MTCTIQLLPPIEASSLCLKITAALPDYFGLPDCNAGYAQGVLSCTNFAALKEGSPVGLLSLDRPYPKSARLYWMALLPEHHGQGIGRQLIESALDFARKEGAKFVSVETVAPEEADAGYLKTYSFYLSCGFEPLFNLKPEGYEWTMVYLLKSL